MKRRNLFITLGLALGLGLGVAAGLGAKGEAKEAKASGVSGKVTLDLTINWASVACNVSVYFYDASSHEGWGSYVSVAKDQYEAEVSYSFADWTPTKMIAVRYNSTYSAESWAANKWGGAETKWNQAPSSDGYAFADHLRITDASTATTDYAVVMGGESGKAWSELVSLNGVKKNGSNHCEYYASVDLTAGQAFKVVYAGVYYGYYTTGEGVAVGDFGGGSGNDIEINTSGTYSLYFDSYTHNVHIANTDYASADEWAQNFLKADCATASTGTKAKWSDHATAYAALTPGAKSYLANEAHVDHLIDKSSDTFIVRAVQRYDYVLERYGKNVANTDELGYDDFMGRAPGKVTPKALNDTSFVSSYDDNNTTLVIVLISTVTLAAIGGYFLLRRRKED